MCWSKSPFQVQVKAYDNLYVKIETREGKIIESTGMAILDIIHQLSMTTTW